MLQNDLFGRLARWNLKLQAYDFHIERRTDTQNIVPDTLARKHIDELIAGNDIFLDIGLDSPCLSQDRSSNRGWSSPW